MVDPMASCRARLATSSARPASSSALLASSSRILADDPSASSKAWRASSSARLVSSARMDEETSARYGASFWALSSRTSRKWPKYARSMEPSHRRPQTTSGMTAAPALPTSPAARAEARAASSRSAVSNTGAPVRWKSERTGSPARPRNVSVHRARCTLSHMLEPAGCMVDQPLYSSVLSAWACWYMVSMPHVPPILCSMPTLCHEPSAKSSTGMLAGGSSSSTARSSRHCPMNPERG